MQGQDRGPRLESAITRRSGPAWLRHRRAFAGPLPAGLGVLRRRGRGPSQPRAIHGAGHRAASRRHTHYSFVKVAVLAERVAPGNASTPDGRPPPLHLDAAGPPTVPGRPSLANPPRLPAAVLWSFSDAGPTGGPRSRANNTPLCGPPVRLGSFGNHHPETGSGRAWAGLQTAQTRPCLPSPVAVPGRHPCPGVPRGILSRPAPRTPSSPSPPLASRSSRPGCACARPVRGT